MSIMDANQRRQAILNRIHQSTQPITGSELAKAFSVSRQIIVQDMAILRAAGENILATPQGYMIPSTPFIRPCVRVFTCKHDNGEMLGEELTTIVDLGGRVIDVIVEHPIYGEYRGALMLSSPASVREFLKRLVTGGAEPLSSLTGGIHLHTVEADNEQILDRISKALKEKGILLEESQ